ncbi:threonylcarbamoyladenosine tRNA methylthiotransferase MtaB [Candidatus Hakubella thermalkaliphila]|uniref:tRNA (N(6)-L-threonylcarbamoyladenosine(37)-C(2))-methylthiotransferase n=1 Tax=Candidatus Hakubella thermalkaliphila TaxID=2754717 RepID=A0A6V8PRP4_9ACTN|nr:tRNA (N(6)-L-threonylcarbamoyladenosine(37)-C(2))-methylthiotransferase MtaB [Candidatus Hakubella thermalkaliphila]GFP35058.1 threonylcarbamoyladenosine tRNA methylthiotransferase MtaB [Candidatus Hakubella thermalkaliphila]
MKGRIRFNVSTLGCRTNLAEADRMTKELEMLGLEHVTLEGNPHLCIINTCTVTQQSDRKSRHLIRQAISHTKGGEVIVTGCYADRQAELLRSIPGVTSLYRNQDKEKIVVDIRRELERWEGSLTLKAPDRRRVLELTHTRALVKIQEGCDQGCAYCIVPSVRGKPRSLGLDQILQEVEGLIWPGCKEIVLTGTNIGKFGQDTGEGDLAELIKVLLERTEIARIRLSSLELNYLSPHLRSLVMEDRRVCRHLHIPLQSGSDEMLRKMNRSYTVDQFVEITQEMQEKVPGLALSTDLMVGFPGETERDFELTCELVRKIGFARLHVFKFSERPGTPALALGEKVEEETKSRRSRCLMELGEKRALNFKQTQVGQILELLVEKDSGEGRYIGMSDNYLRVSFWSPRALHRGDLARVLVKATRGAEVQGELVASPDPRAAGTAITVVELINNRQGEQRCKESWWPRRTQERRF